MAIFSPRLQDRLGDHFADGLGLVLDEMLLVQAALFVELFHLAADDFLDHLLRLAGGACLGAINLALALEHFRGYVFPANVAGIHRGNVHGHIVAELLERVGTRNEIAFAVDFDDHADFSAGMNVMTDRAFRGFARRLLCGRGLTLLAQDIDRFLDIPVGFNKRRAAIAESRVGLFSQFLDKLGWDFHNWLRCTHPFLSFLCGPNFRFDSRKMARRRKCTQRRAT